MTISGPEARNAKWKAAKEAIAALMDDSTIPRPLLLEAMEDLRADVAMNLAVMIDDAAGLW